MKDAILAMHVLRDLKPGDVVVAAMRSGMDMSELDAVAAWNKSARAELPEGVGFVMVEGDVSVDRESASPMCDRYAYVDMSVGLLLQLITQGSGWPQCTVTDGMPKDTKLVGVEFLRARDTVRLFVAHERLTPGKSYTPTFTTRG